MTLATVALRKGRSAAPSVRGAALGGAWLLPAAMIVSGVLTYAFHIVAARTLGPAAYGQIAVLWGAMFLIAIVLFRPVEQTTSRAIADRLARGEEVRSVLRAVGSLSLMLIVAAAVLAILGWSTLTQRLFDGDNAMTTMLVAGVVAYGMSYLVRGVLGGTRWFAGYSLGLVVDSVARLAVAAPLLLVASKLTAATAVVAAGVAGAIVPLLVGRKHLRGLRDPGAGAPFKLSSALSFAGPAGVVAGADQLFVNGGPLLVVAAGGPGATRAAGIVFAATMLVRAPVYVFQGLAAALLPNLTHLQATADAALFRRAVLRTVAFLLGCGGLIAAGMALAGPAAMSTLYGSDFQRRPDRPRDPRSRRRVLPRRLHDLAGAARRRSSERGSQGVGGLGRSLRCALFRDPGRQPDACQRCVHLCDAGLSDPARRCAVGKDAVVRTPIRVGLVGLGERGTRLARTFDELPGAEIRWLCDRSPDVRMAHRARFPSASWTASFGDILTDDGVDAVVIATPASNRFDLALRALEADKHVFVEQPIALGGEEAQVLVDEAEARDRILAVGNAVLFQPAVRKLKELVVAGALGDVYYMHADRHRNGGVRSDENALWHLGAQDIAVLLYLLDDQPIEVAARGESYLRGELPDVVFAYLKFATGISAHLHFSWLDPLQQRRTTVVGAERMAVIDDLEPERKLTIYDKREVGLRRSRSAITPMGASATSSRLACAPRTRRSSSARASWPGSAPRSGEDRTVATVRRSSRSWRRCRSLWTTEGSRSRS